MLKLASVLRNAPVMRTAGCVLIPLLAVACTSGDPANPNNDTRGIQCTTHVNITGPGANAGTFTQTQAPPAPPLAPNCWPIGKWVFSVTVDTTMSTCTPAPTPLGKYEFDGSTTTDMNGDYIEAFAYVPQANDPTANYHVGANEGGTGLCEGDLELYSADGKQVWIFKPELNADNTLTGGGEFRIYGSDQWLGM